MPQAVQPGRAVPCRRRWRWESSVSRSLTQRHTPHTQPRARARAHAPTFPATPRTACRFPSGRGCPQVSSAHYTCAATRTCACAPGAYAAGAGPVCLCVGARVQVCVRVSARAPARAHRTPIVHGGTGKQRADAGAPLHAHAKADAARLGRTDAAIVRWTLMHAGADSGLRGRSVRAVAASSGCAPYGAQAAA